MGRKVKKGGTAYGVLEQIIEDDILKLKVGFITRDEFDVAKNFWCISGIKDNTVILIKHPHRKHIEQNIDESDILTHINK